MKEVHIEVHGRVQGVTFRHFVKTNADKLGIVGTVQNRDDGSVFIVAQGTRKQLDELLLLVQKGPMLANVEGVSYFWREVGEQYEDFKIVVEKNVISDQKSSFWNLGKKLLGVKSTVPKHVAIIPDGNRRWATEAGLKKTAGHAKSVQYENVVSLLEETQRLGVDYLTFWGFSTENWKRDSKEIAFLMSLLRKWVKTLHKEAITRKIRFRHLGRKDRLPKKLMDDMKALEEATKDNEGLCVQLCLDYGGRDEMRRAINRMLKAGVQEIEEEDISQYLDSAGIPDPDLIIRTSGENRTSGFMPYQSTYAEFYFCEKHFPEFGAEDLREAVEAFSKRRRRFGGG